MATPERRTEWRKDAEADKRDQYPCPQAKRILALLDELEAVERERNEWRDVSVGPAYAIVLRQRVERAEAERGSLRMQYDASQEALSMVLTENRESVEEVQRLRAGIEALADKWEGDRLNTGIDKEAAAYLLRALLAGDGA